jgi:hypothetical protein
MLRRVVWLNFTDVSEVLIASIIRAMSEAVSTSEALVSLYQTTRRYIPEDSHLHARRRENLKFLGMSDISFPCAFMLLYFDPF